MEEPKKVSSSQQEAGKEGFVKSLISGSLLGEKIILGNLGYLGLLTLIGAIYIGNRFHSEKVIRKTAILMEEVKELRSESMASSADLMYLSKQSEVLRLIREKGLELKELKEPPYKLVVKK